MATTAKSYDFPVTVHWLDGRLTRATAVGKPDLAIATPPEFKNGIPGVWSPEDLLVVSVGSCYAVTLLAIAERRDLPVHGLDVGARGRVAQRPDGQFGFTGIQLEVAVVTDVEFEDEMRNAADAAERGCLIAASLDVPVELDLTVRTPKLVEELI